ncbi:MAG: glycosyltransferase family 2 protein, partial [Acidimicrobiia bacterium]|nr:glycosyltransferase family 2 protein [Acidimicrobiia bacterium]
MTRPDVVSVIIVNYEGADDTIAALEALRDVDWPTDHLEIVVVDNASHDGSIARIADAFPEVKLIALDTNVGFAGGCNRGVDAATGEYVAFLNNDAKPDASWLRAAVDVLGEEQSIVCVASKILDWDGNAVDFVDAAMSFYGHGFKVHAGEPDSPLHDVAADVLFASGAAMVVDAEVFRTAGGFDDRYFMFFEDVDFGWRLWMLGHRVRYVPDSIVYHRHHATMDRFRPWREDYLLERNALFTIFKNYEDRNLTTALAPALLLALRRGLVKGGDDPDALDLERGDGGEDTDRLEVSKTALASAYAVDALTRALPDLATARRKLQGERRRSDHEILRLFKLPLFANIGDPGFVGPFNSAVDVFGLAGVFAERRRVLIATGDVLEPRMAGPAIRAWQLACALSREHEVQLVTTLDCALSHPDFSVRTVEDPELSAAVDWCDVVIFQGNLMAQHHALRTTNKIVVADIYDPFHLEVLEQARTLAPQERRFASRSTKDVLNEQLMRGDFFLCASDKQRDFWLGQLAAVGRVNPATYDENESLSSLITVVPFGVSDEAPRHNRPV